MSNEQEDYLTLLEMWKESKSKNHILNVFHNNGALVARAIYWASISAYMSYFELNELVCALEEYAENHR